MEVKTFVKHLRRYKIIGLDTNIFIYHFNEDETFLPLTVQLFSLLDQKNIRFITSVITWEELLTIGDVFKDEKIREIYRSFVFGPKNLQVDGITIEDAERAADLRLKYGLRTPDALQIAVCLRNGAQVFVTNDDQLKKVKEMAVLILKDFV